jgi:hypothetical protein
MCSVLPVRCSLVEWTAEQHSTVCHAFASIPAVCLLLQMYLTDICFASRRDWGHWPQTMSSIRLPEEYTGIPSLRLCRYPIPTNHHKSDATSLTRGMCSIAYYSNTAKALLTRAVLARHTNQYEQSSPANISETPQTACQAVEIPYTLFTIHECNFRTTTNCSFESHVAIQRGLSAWTHG